MAERNHLNKNLKATELDKLTKNLQEQSSLLHAQQFDRTRYWNESQFLFCNAVLQQN
jgi:hypothetical protein